MSEKIFENRIEKKEEISKKMILGIIMLAVFMVQFLINWSVADAPFWPMLMHEAGFSSEEIAITGVYRQIIISVVGIGTSIGLLLLNFYLGKNYRLTKASTTVLILVLATSIIAGLFLGYGLKQLQFPQYSILNLGILAVIPRRLLSPIVWCMLEMVAGNYKREIEKRRN
jgi:hypothetical protein